MTEIVYDGRTTDGRTRDHGHPISSPGEPKIFSRNIGLYKGKSENSGYFGNYCSLRPES